MSAYQRVKVSMLKERYARAFGVQIDAVNVELREDEDAEVWTPGVGVVWTLSGKPYASTLERASDKR